MAYSGQETLRFLMIGQYKYDVSTRGLKFRKFSRSTSAQTELVGRIANPDLMRHYVFMDIRASDLSYHNVIKSLDSIPSEYISVIIKYCDTCGKHFMQTWCKSIVGSHDLTCYQCHQAPRWSNQGDKMRILSLGARLLIYVWPHSGYQEYSWVLS